MFELTLIACIGLRVCEFVEIPMPLPTERRCEQQAAIAAGMVKAHYHPNWSLSYRFRCQPMDGDPGDWILVEAELPAEPKLASRD